MTRANGDNLYVLHGGGRAFVMRTTSPEDGAVATVATDAAMRGDRAPVELTTDGGQVDTWPVCATLDLGQAARAIDEWCDGAVAADFAWVEDPPDEHE